MSRLGAPMMPVGQIERKSMTAECTPSLVLAWIQAPKEPDAMWWWGQICCGMHRLVDVREHFDQVSRMRDASRALRMFDTALGLYWWHCYAVRERVIELLSIQTGNRTAAGRMKSKRTRRDAAVLLAEKDPCLTGKVERLMEQFDSLLLLRNRYTHEHYLGVTIHVAGKYYDVEELVTQYEDLPSGRDLLAGVARVVRKKARECARHVQESIDYLSVMLDSTWRGVQRLRQQDVSGTMMHVVPFP